MRIRTGHGKDDWTENVPSEARTNATGGTLDFGGPSGVSPYLNLKGEPNAMKKMNDAHYRAMGRGKAA